MALFFYSSLALSGSLMLIKSVLLQEGNYVSFLVPGGWVSAQQKGLLLVLWFYSQGGNRYGQEYLISYGLHENWEKNGADEQLSAR